MIDVDKFIKLRKELDSINSKKQELITRDNLLREQVTSELAALGLNSIDELKVEIDRLSSELEVTAREAEEYIRKSREELNSING